MYLTVSQYIRAKLSFFMFNLYLWFVFKSTSDCEVPFLQEVTSRSQTSEACVVRPNSNGVAASNIFVTWYFYRCWWVQGFNVWEEIDFPKIDDWKTTHCLKSVCFLVSQCWILNESTQKVTISFGTLPLREWWGTNLGFLPGSLKDPLEAINAILSTRHHSRGFLSQTLITSLFSEYIPWRYNYI